MSLFPHVFKLFLILSASQFLLEFLFTLEFYFPSKILSLHERTHLNLTLQCIECLQNSMDNCSYCCHWHTALTPVTLSQCNQAIHSLVIRTSSTSTYFELHFIGNTKFISEIVSKFKFSCSQMQYFQ